MSKRDSLLRLLLWVLAIVLMVIVVVVVFGLVPKWLLWHAEGISTNQPDLPELENSYRQTVAQILGGVVLLVGLGLTLLRIRANERQLQVALEGQITERFTRAIDQLGNEELFVRVGGIYSLERIARDSPPDHWTVVEILTAFVRERAPLNAQREEVLGGRFIFEGRDVTPSERPSTDVQAALTVVGRRQACQDPKDAQLNLSGVRIPGCNLHSANLERANLRGSVLNEATLVHARLAGADLRDASIIDARLGNVDLSGADLTSTILSGSLMEHANLEGAVMGWNEQWEWDASVSAPPKENEDAYPATATDLRRTDLSSARGLRREQLERAKMDPYTGLPSEFDEIFPGRYP